MLSSMSLYGQSGACATRSRIGGDDRRCLPGVNRLAAALAIAACTVLAGCGDRPPQRDDLPRSAPSVGPDARWQPPPRSDRVARAGPVAGMRCTREERPRFGVHVEVFARRKVLIVASGIGIAPPFSRDGAYVRGGRCSYPLRTREPTGVVEVERGPTRTLGDLFALWGQPLSPRRIGRFRGRVSAYVGGRRRRGDPRRIPLRRHGQIVLQVQGHVPPHASYRFPPGL